MKHHALPFFLLLIAILAYSCKGKQITVDGETSTMSQKQYKKIAQETCDCMSELFDWASKTKKLQEAGDTEGLKALLPLGDGIIKEMETCMNNLEKKYAHINNADEQKLDDAFKKQCPEIANMLQPKSMQ